MTESARHVCGDRENACVLEGCVRLPPFNIVDAQHIRSPTGSAARMNASPSLRVVVFESANPSFTFPTLDA